MIVECETCYGSGGGIDAATRCPVCLGYGRVFVPDYDRHEEENDHECSDLDQLDNYP